MKKQVLQSIHALTNRQISDLISSGLKSFESAGLAIAYWMERDEDWLTNFCAEVKWLNPRRVLAFRDVGLRKRHAITLVSDSPGVKALSKCNYETQSSYFDNHKKVKVLKADGTVTDKDVFDLSADESAQAIGELGARTIKEQEQFIEERLIVEVKPVNGSPKVTDEFTIYVRRHTLIVSHGGKKLIINRGDVLKYLTQMETSR